MGFARAQPILRAFRAMSFSSYDTTAIGPSRRFDAVRNLIAFAAARTLVGLAAGSPRARMT
jgi:hypothetical protein